MSVATCSARRMLNYRSSRRDRCRSHLPLSTPLLSGRSRRSRGPCVTADGPIGVLDAEAGNAQSHVRVSGAVNVTQNHRAGAPHYLRDGPSVCHTMRPLHLGRWGAFVLAGGSSRTPWRTRQKVPKVQDRRILRLPIHLGACLPERVCRTGVARANPQIALSRLHRHAGIHRYPRPFGPRGV